RRLAERYKAHPALAMWHINNEYGCHVSECMCDVCAGRFREWLSARYRTIENLNKCWGTAFWSQHYNGWDEILPPRKAPTYRNPSQQLDYLRFMNESLLDLCRTEASILRASTPAIPLTTNFMGFFKPLDYVQWAQTLDVVSWDCYPNPAAHQRPARETWPGYPSHDMNEVLQSACAHDLMRSLKGGQPFILMEQAPSHVYFRESNAPKRPGVMRLWSYQAMAHGADGILFFQWRASKAGAEKFQSGMVPHAGRESRTFHEIATLGRELRGLDAVLGATVAAEVAIVTDWQSRWAMELDSRPARLDTVQHLRYSYDLFYHQNIPVDFVTPEGDWTKYKLVIAPALHMLTEKAAKSIREYVHGGGSFVTSYFSGVVDENDQVWLGGYPALLKDVLGISVEEWYPYPEKCTIKVPGETKELPCSTWAELVRLHGARVSAVFNWDYLAGSPALTINDYGKGKALYMATMVEPSWMVWLMSDFLKQLDIRPVLRTPRGVEATVRSKRGRDFLFLLNHNTKVETVDLGEWKGVDLVSGKALKARVKLAPNGVAILEQKRP
ncbi:MAG: beta-galactosidase, partial [Planctomycetota bacterium]|nr:beta-galactosidase [Planctomycetota bacterium]